MNIVLTGMPGAGKSTIGVILAKVMKMPFADTDLFIQERKNMTLQEIINSGGIDEFLKTEEQVILELELKNTVIATGGSVVLSEAAMEALGKRGITVYLKLPFEEIEARIKNITTRGIAMGDGQSLQDIYKERRPLYERYADIVIDCMGRDMEEIVSIIKDRVEKFLNKNV